MAIARAFVAVTPEFPDSPDAFHNKPPSELLLQDGLAVVRTTPTRNLVSLTCHAVTSELSIRS